jgi:hypothetical protein
MQEQGGGANPAAGGVGEVSHSSVQLAFSCSMLSLPSAVVLLTAAAGSNTPLSHTASVDVQHS